MKVNIKYFMRAILKNWNVGMSECWKQNIIPLFRYFIFITFIAASSVVSAQTLKDAIRLTVNEQFEEATGTFKALVQKEPANATNYYYFGKNYIQQEDLDSAKIIFQK